MPDNEILSGDEVYSFKFVENGQAEELARITAEGEIVLNWPAIERHAATDQHCKIYLALRDGKYKAA